MDFRFASKNNPKTLAYRIADDLVYGNVACKGHSSCTFGVAYETCGDGITQHGGDMAITPYLLGDFCASLLDFAFGHPEDANLREFIMGHWPHRRLNDERMAFLAGLRHNPVKPAWYSQQDNKVSRNHERQYDKRWVEVPAWADGRPENSLRIIVEAIEGGQLLEKLLVAQDCLRIVNQTHPGIARWFGLIREDEHLDHLRTLDAVVALDLLVSGYRQIEHAKRSLECWIHNRGINRETAEPAKEMA